MRCLKSTKMVTCCFYYCWLYGKLVYYVVILGSLRTYSLLLFLLLELYRKHKILLRVYVLQVVFSNKTVKKWKSQRQKKKCREIYTRDFFLFRYLLIPLTKQSNFEY